MKIEVMLKKIFRGCFTARYIHRSMLKERHKREIEKFVKLILIKDQSQAEEKKGHNSDSGRTSHAISENNLFN